MKSREISGKTLSTVVMQYYYAVDSSELLLIVNWNFSLRNYLRGRTCSDEKLILKSYANESRCICPTGSFFLSLIKPTVLLAVDAAGKCRATYS